MGHRKLLVKMLLLVIILKFVPMPVIEGWTSIGKDCVIFPGASIGAEPQDLKFNGEKSYVIIGDVTNSRMCDS